MTNDFDTRRYVERWFWTLAQLAEAVGATRGETERLIAAGCGPGPSYVAAADGWWSALDAPERSRPAGEAWYSPAAAWGLRRARKAIRGGATPAEAAAANLGRFERDFAAALARHSLAPVAFAHCFVDGQVEAVAVSAAAAAEWQGWLLGGYGVCLRVFTGETCVAKESLGATMKAALSTGEGDPAILLD